MEKKEETSGRDRQTDRQTETEPESQRQRQTETERTQTRFVFYTSYKDLILFASDIKIS